MSSSLFRMAGAVVISLAVAGLAFGQTTQTTTTAVQNPDGSWTVVEYPLDREVVVQLMPTAVVPRATVRRTANGTTIIVDPASVAGVHGNLNLYAVDSTGRVTLLGPVSAGNDAPLTFSTPLDRFMLVLSPEANLTTVMPNTAVTYKSSVPTGLSIVPIARSGEGPNAPRGAEVEAVASPSYAVPMLGVPSLPRNKETEIRVAFDGTVPFVRANLFITPKEDGTTRVKLKLHELSRVPNDAHLTLWAVSPDGQFLRLGSATGQGSPNVATIDTEEGNVNRNVRWRDFGIFITTETSGTVVSPAGPVIMRIVR